MKIRLRSSIFSIQLTAMVVGAIGLSSARVIAQSSAANSHVGISKLASLRVSSIDSSELIFSNSRQKTQSKACLQSSGEDVPYRISASSLSSDKRFSVKGRDSVIPYQLRFSGLDNREWILGSKKDQTGVFSATSTNSCAMNFMAVQLDKGAFESAKNGLYIDTLSLMLVIE